MNSNSIRIGIDYEGNRRALIISPDADIKLLISMALTVFNLSAEEIGNWKLIIQGLDCELITAGEVLNNDILLLKRKEDKIQIILPVLNPFLKTVLEQEDQRGDLDSASQNEKEEIESDPLQNSNESEEEKVEEEEEEIANYLEDGSFHDDPGQEISEEELEQGDDDEFLDDGDGDEVELDELLQLKFENRRDLAEKVKSWATEKKMTLSFKETERINVKVETKVSI